MAVAVRAVNGENITQGNTPDITVVAGDFAVGAGAVSSAVETISSATLGATAMTAVGASNFVRAFRLLDPDVAPGTGARTFTPVPSGSATLTGGIVALLTGVNESDPIGEVGGPNGTGTSGSTTRTTVAGDLVVVFVTAGGAAGLTISAVEGTTKDYDASENEVAVVMLSKLATDTSTTVEWTLNQSVFWRGHAVVIKAAAAGSAHELAPSVAGQATATPTMYAVVELGGGEVAGSASVSAAMKVVREVEVSVGSVAGTADVSVSLAAVRGLGATSNLCPEGGFDRPSVNWTLGANWQIADGVASQTAPALSSLRYTITAVVGATYHIQYTVTNETAGGSLVAGIGGVAGTSRAGNGTFTDTLVATTAGQLLFTASGTWDGDLDDVIVSQVGTASVSSAAVRELGASVGGEAATDVAISGVRVTEHDATVEGEAGVTVSVGVLRVFGATVAGTSTTSSGVSESQSVAATVAASAEASVAAAVRRGLAVTVAGAAETTVAPAFTRSFAVEVGAGAGVTVTAAYTRGLSVEVSAAAEVIANPAYRWVYAPTVVGLGAASARMLPNYGVTYDGLYAVEHALAYELVKNASDLEAEHALAYQLVKAASETEAFD